MGRHHFLSASEIDALADRLSGRLDWLNGQPQALKFPADAPGLNYKASTTAKVTVDVPPGTAGLVLITSTGFTSLSAVGATSRFPYLPVGAAYAAAQMFTIPWSSVPDDRAEFAIVTAAGQAGVLYAAASAVPGISYVNQPWLVPNQPPISVSQAGAGTSALIAPIAGQSIYVFGGLLTVRTAAAGGSGILVLTSGPGIAEVHTDSVSNAVSFQLNGSRLPLGVGLNLNVGGTGTVAAFLSYSQA